MNEELKPTRLDTEPPPAVISGISAKEASDLLFQLLLEVVRRHQPEIEPVLLGGANISGFTPELMARALQAQGICSSCWPSPSRTPPCAAAAISSAPAGARRCAAPSTTCSAEAASEGIAPEEIQTLLSGLRIRPVITAHPTELKRVTVLEKYRKIYLLLRELEQPRWTERERTALIDDLRDQIELVWMTGELHLEKPTVQHEVSRGLHFFDEALFEKAPEMLALIDGALERYYPGRNFELPPFFQFGSWIGGDRDGNPSVTTARHRLDAAPERARRAAPLQHRIIDLARALSITERALPVPPDFQRRACPRARAAAARPTPIKKRNPGEPYRQYLSIVLRKLDATIARVEGMDIGGPGAPYRQCRRADPGFAGDRAARCNRRTAPRSPPIWSGRCAAPSRCSASPPCGSISARTPPRLPRRFRRCGGRPPATATTARPSSAAANGGRGCSARWPGP